MRITSHWSTWQEFQQVASHGVPHLLLIIPWDLSFCHCMALNWQSPQSWKGQPVGSSKVSTMFLTKVHLASAWILLGMENLLCYHAAYSPSWSGNPQLPPVGLKATLWAPKQQQNHLHREVLQMSAVSCSASLECLPFLAQHLICGSHS